MEVEKCRSEKERKKNIYMTDMGIVSDLAHDIVPHSHAHVDITRATI